MMPHPIEIARGTPWHSRCSKRPSMVIVDGNNVPSPLRPWHARSWSAPVRLVMDLARLTRAWDSCVDLVFDGPPRTRLRDGAVIEGILVTYSWRATADERIVEIARNVRRDGEDAMVVTSDRELGARVRSEGAVVIASDELRRALDRVNGAAHLGLPLRSPLLAGPRALAAPHEAMHAHAPGARTPPAAALARE